MGAHPDQDSTQPGEPPQKGEAPRGKDKKKKKKEKGPGFFRGAFKLALKILPFVGIRIPGSLKAVAKEALGGTGLKAPDGLGGLGLGHGGPDLRDAGRVARKVAQAASVAESLSAPGASGAVSPPGSDTVEGITIEVFAQATAAMGRAAQAGGNYEQALTALGMDLARYQRVTAAFTELMKSDSNLGVRYAQAYQTAMGG